MTGALLMVQDVHAGYLPGVPDSHGCIRMYNQDIMDLYARVSVGTEVVVLR